MILVCEPQCQGYEHVEFNAALLAAVRFAFGESILFLAEPGHLGLVAHKAAEAMVEGVSYRPLDAPPRHQRGARRMLSDGRLHLEILERARLHEARAVLFSSTTTAGLFALKLLADASPVPCAVVPHGVLDSLDGKADRWFPRVLRMRNPKRLHYLLLAPSIERAVLQKAPALRGATATLEHPYLFSDLPARVPDAPPLHVGSIGVALREKGLAELISVARDVVAARPGKISFAHVGPVLDAELAHGAREVIEFPVPRAFLDRPAFERELARLDYALFLYPRDSYRYSVSGALLDAVSLLKPIVALRNPYFEHCFEQMGDIGYLCDTVDQVKDLLLQLSARFPKAHYLQQQEELRRGRHAFSPRAVGAALRAAFASWESRSP